MEEDQNTVSRLNFVVAGFQPARLKALSRTISTSIISEVGLQRAGLKPGSTLFSGTMLLLRAHCQVGM